MSAVSYTRAMIARAALILILASSRCMSQAPEIPAGALVKVPAMTPVLLRLGTEITSNKNKPGDTFPIFIAEDVRIGDVLVIPAGTEGLGEVVHAAKSGMGGKAGELILAARFVRVGDQQVRLRSFGVAGAGRDHTDDALAASFFLGPLGLAVHGGARIFPRDAVAGAKTAEDVQLPARETPIDTTKKGREEDEPKTS